MIEEDNDLKAKVNSCGTLMVLDSPIWSQPLGWNNSN